jgi:hypothetical protein
MPVSSTTFAPLLAAGAGHGYQRAAQQPLAVDKLSQTGANRPLPGWQMVAMAHGLLLSLSDIINYIRLGKKVKQYLHCEFAPLGSMERKTRIQAGLQVENFFVAESLRNWAISCSWLAWTSTPSR